MDKVVNLGIPHVAEQIFQTLDDQALVQCLMVSKTWKTLAENVLITKWSGQLIAACKLNDSEVSKALSKHCWKKATRN